MTEEEERRERNRKKMQKYRETHRDKYNAKMRAYRNRHPGRALAAEKRRYAKNRDEINARRRKRYPELREKRSAANKKYRSDNPERVRANNLRRYGMTSAQFVGMREAQGGACAICREAFAERPRVDHCHSSGENRGLLCNTCNLGLGQFRDDPERLEAAAAYIRHHRKPQLALSTSA